MTTSTQVKPALTERQIKAEERKQARLAAKAQAKIEVERNQKPVSSITFTIEWAKSRMWNANPHCTAEVWFKDGTFEQSPVFRCSGCGYDKTSTVIADAFNAYLLYKLWAMTPEQIKGGRGSDDKGPAPYGINYRPADSWTDDSGKVHHRTECRYYADGIGMSCYPLIGTFIGGKFETIIGGKAFDVFRYTDG